MKYRRGMKRTWRRRHSVYRRMENAHKGMEARSSDRTKRFLVFDAPPLALPVSTNNNSKNNKKENGGSSFGAALLAPAKSRGVSGFSFDLSSSSAIHGGTVSISGDKVLEV